MRWLGEVVIAVDIDVVGLVGTIGWRHPEQNALIGRPHERPQSFFGGLAPDELRKCRARSRVHDFEVRIIGCVSIKLLTCDHEVVGGAVLENVDVLLCDEELLLLALHVDKVDAKLVNDRCLFAVQGREAGNFGSRVAWKGCF